MNTVAGRAAESAWARRVSSSRWRDPRLALGLLLVLVSVLAGARLLSAADSYAEVWSAHRDLSTGSTLQADDLEVRRVRFADQADADRYLAATEPVAGAVLSRPLGAGELVPRAALDAAPASSLAQLPLGVEPAAAPADLTPGDVVDVWVVPDPESVSVAGGQGRSATSSDALAERVLSRVSVLSSGDPAASLGSSGQRTVVVGVASRDVADLPALLPSLARGRVVLVRLGG